MSTDRIEEMIEEFYSTFPQRHEASMKRVKEVDGKVEAYFIEDWLRAQFQELEAEADRRVEEAFLEGFEEGQTWQMPFENLKNYDEEKYDSLVSKYIKSTKQITHEHTH